MHELSPILAQVSLAGQTDDHGSSIAGCEGASRHRSASARRTVGAFGANHSAHGGQRNDGPRQCRFAGQVDRRIQQGRDRDDQRRSRQSFAGTRGTAEDRIRVGEDCSGHPIGNQDVERNQEAGMISAVTIAPVVLQMSCVAGLLAVALVAIALSRSKSSTAVVYGATLVICAAALLGSLRWLLSDAANTSDMTLPIGLPWLGAHFRLDALASFFLVVVNLGGAAASLYGLGYGHHDPAPHRVLPFFPAFLAGMNIVVLADDAFTFLVSWEFMSLSSWALVMAHHRVGENVRAGYVYLIMASFGTLALLLTFGLLAGPDGGYAFGDIRGGHPSATVAASILVLALIGAGSKAGLVPLHVWLPLAHPAAPSHVSALMSGVMTKVAVYG